MYVYDFVDNDLFHVFKLFIGIILISCLFLTTNEDSDASGINAYQKASGHD